MTQELIQCNCNCGTRICLDEQLIEERETWKQKYLTVQKQNAKDIGLMKERIYQECSALMLKEFNKKQKDHTDALNEKGVKIQELTSKIIKLETSLKISQKENEILKQKLKEEQDKFSQKLQQIAEINRKHNKNINFLSDQNLSETNQLRIKILQENDQLQAKLQAENQHLKHKVKEFEKKYQQIIPEVQKLKAALAKKCSDIEILQNQLEKLKSIREKETMDFRRKLQEATEVHLPCQSKINKMSQTIAQLERDLQKAKNLKREVKVEAVYVDRPVQVERIVEKVVEVERIVKQYIEPENSNQLEQENKRLKQELNNLVHEIQQFEVRYLDTVRQNQSSIAEYQDNLKKYKDERVSLVKKIQQQDHELERIYELISSKKNSQNEGGCNPERIVVQVGADGSYNKRIERINSPSNEGNQRVNVHTTVGNFKTSSSANNHHHYAKGGSGTVTSTTSNYKATKSILRKK